MGSAHRVIILYRAQGNPPPSIVINFGDIWPTSEPLSAVLGTNLLLVQGSIHLGGWVHGLPCALYRFLTLWICLIREFIFELLVYWQRGSGCNVGRNNKTSFSFMFKIRRTRISAECYSKATKQEN